MPSVLHVSSHVDTEVWFCYMNNPFISVLEFPTTKEELLIVFDIIDENDCGTITHQQFHNALSLERSPAVSLKHLP